MGIENLAEAERVMIFIDGSNVFWGCRYYEQDHGTHPDIDYVKLAKHLAGQRRIVRTTFYCSVPPIIPEEQANFHEYLRKSGIQVIPKLLKARTDPKTGKQRYVEKGVDVALATDLLAFAWEGVYDTAILISGDGDYIGCVQKVMSKGKNVEVVSFRKQCNKELKNSGVTCIYIDDVLESIKKS